MNQEFIAFSDGSCNNRGLNKPGGSAYIILDMNGNVIKKKSKGFTHTTNNRMEMLAIISIVNSLPYGSAVTIYTDSQYCIAALQSTRPKKNLDQVALFHRIVKEKRLWVMFRWVRGHTGNTYNEECDKMAKAEYTKILDQQEQFYSNITTKKHKKKPKKH